MTVDRDDPLRLLAGSAKQVERGRDRQKVACQRSAAEVAPRPREMFATTLAVIDPIDGPPTVGITSGPVVIPGEGSNG
jgi:hypothetical protein